VEQIGGTGLVAGNVELLVLSDRGRERVSRCVCSFDSSWDRTRIRRRDELNDIAKAKGTTWKAKVISALAFRPFLITTRVRGDDRR
jgi:hypothetical protein